MDRLRVAYRIDAGRIYGTAMGHAYRCAAINEALGKHKKISACAYGVFDSAGASLLAASGIEPVPFNSQDTTSLEQAFAADQAPLKIIDLADFALKQYSTPEANSHHYHTVIDEHGDFTGSAEAIISGVVSEDMPTAGQASRLRLCGLHYAVLGGCVPEIFSLEKTMPTVTITFGGADPSGLTLDVAKALKGAKNFGLVICVGPAYGETAALKQFCSEHLPNAMVKQAVPDLLGELAASTVAVAAGGMTSLELAALGVPAILIPSRASEERMTGRLDSLGCAMMLPRTELARLPDLLTRLIGDGALRATMAEKGRAAVDFDGANRLSQALLADFGSWQQQAQRSV